MVVSFLADSGPYMELADLCTLYEEIVERFFNKTPYSQQVVCIVYVNGVHGILYKS